MQTQTEFMFYITDRVNTPQKNMRYKVYSLMSVFNAKKKKRLREAQANAARGLSLLQPRIVNSATAEKKKNKNKQGTKTQRVDPPKFTTRVAKRRPLKKTTARVNFPIEFFTVRSSTIFRYCVLSILETYFFHDNERENVS